MKGNSLLIELIGAMFNTREWDDILGIDALDKENCEALDKAMEKIFGPLSLKQIDDMHSAVYDYAYPQNAAAMLYGMYVAHTIQGVSAGPRSIEAAITQLVKGSAEDE